jgi:hypothetical protein
MARTKKHSNNKTKRHHMKNHGSKKNTRRHRGKRHHNITRRHGGEHGPIRKGVGMLGNAIIFIPKRIAMGAFVGIKTGVKGFASGVGSGLKRTFVGKDHH